MYSQNCEEKREKKKPHVADLKWKVQTHTKRPYSNDDWVLKDSCFELISTISMLCPLKLKVKNTYHLVHLATLYCI